MEDIFLGGDLDFDNLIELRRQAFVDLMTGSMEGKKYLGYFAWDFDEALVRAYGFLPVPLQGVDPYIFQHGDYDACDCIKSTMIYLTTGRCPILHSCSAFVISSCTKLYQAMAKETEKKVFFLDGNIKLEEILESNLKADFNPEVYEESTKLLKEIGSLLKDLSKSDLSGRELFLLEFFSRYIVDLGARLEFLERVAKVYPVKGIHRKNISCICPWNSIRQIDQDQDERNYHIIPAFNGEYGLEKCIFKPCIQYNYEGETK